MIETKPGRPEFESYYELQYRDKKDPETWKCFGPTARGIYKSYVEACKDVRDILVRIKESKDAGIHEPFCLEYQVVERQVTVKTEVIKTFTVE